LGIRANKVIAAALCALQRASIDPLMAFIPVLKAPVIAAILGSLNSLRGVRSLAVF
jgi:hypothetical protein